MCRTKNNEDRLLDINIEDRNLQKRIIKERGITLVALIITIIVLVILSTVAISTITNTGIVNHAIKGAQDYSEAQKDEESKLNNIQETLENAISGNVTPTNAQKYSVSITKGNNIETVEGDGEYEAGESVTVRAILKSNYVEEQYTYSPATGETSPANGNTRYKKQHSYTYLGWAGDYESNELEYTFTMPDEDVDLSASAEENINYSESQTWKLTELDHPGVVNIRSSRALY